MIYFHKLLNGMKVKIKLDHSYLNITKGQIGTITTITNDGQVSIKFKGRKTVLVFCADEIERVK